MCRTNVFSHILHRSLQLKTFLNKFYVRFLLLKIAVFYNWQNRPRRLKVRRRHIPALEFETIVRQACSDWRDARILVILLIYPSQQGYSSSAESISNS
jgi:hypothetical protein